MGTAPPPPQVSRDGKFYWDGQRWVPMQTRVPSPPSRKTLRERLGMTGALNSCVGYGCIAIALIFVVFAVTALCTSITHPVR